jgi:hypothetical protein
MHRTTLVIPEPLKQKAVARARAEGISFGAFVRRAIEEALRTRKPPAAHLRDPFWADTAVFDGPIPEDLSLHHDS